MEAPNAFPVAQDHGTSVAAVAAGYGNDSTGVTGMMWRARLRMYDMSLNGSGDWQDLWAKLLQARMDGARVVNMSVGYPWTALGGRPDTVTNAATMQANLATLRNLYRGFRRAMDSLPAASQPLVVFSAGNASIDAKWNAARVAADSAPVNGWAVLVVGGSNRADGPYTRTNTGPLVRVAAPAEDVFMLQGDGTIASGEGTSYAAPMVAGLAGLLFSFDPRLTAGQVHDLVIDGALRGGRRAGTGPPIINAHESLMLAGRRAGAPLCGNRMWVADGKFFAQRDTASPTGEVLFPAPVSGRSGTVAFNAMHGGKDVMFYTRPSRTGRRWSASGWTTIPFSDTGPNNGAFLSRAGQSHGQDSTLVLERELSSAPRTITWRPVVRTAAGEVRLPNVITDSLYEDSGLCLSRFVEVPAGRHSDLANHDDPAVRDAYLDWRQRIGFPGNCTLIGPVSGITETLQFLAYAPVGQQAYVFIVRRRTTASPTGSRTCTRAAGLYTSGGTHLATVFYTAECIDASTVTASAGTAAYRINIPTGAITPMSWTESSFEVWSPMIRENGRELLVERQNYRGTVSSRWVDDYGEVAQLESPVTATGECILQFRDLQTGTVNLSPGTCVGSSGGQGGFSAVRSPGS